MLDTFVSIANFCNKSVLFLRNNFISQKTHGGKGGAAFSSGEKCIAKGGSGGNSSNTCSGGNGGSVGGNGGNYRVRVRVLCA